MLSGWESKWMQWKSRNDMKISYRTRSVWEVQRGSDSKMADYFVVIQYNIYFSIVCVCVCYLIWHYVSLNYHLLDCALLLVFLSLFFPTFIKRLLSISSLISTCLIANLWPFNGKKTFFRSFSFFISFFTNWNYLPFPYFILSFFFDFLFSFFSFLQKVVFLLSYFLHRDYLI